MRIGGRAVRALNAAIVPSRALCFYVQSIKPIPFKRLCKNDLFFSAQKHTKISYYKRSPHSLGGNLLPCLPLVHSRVKGF